MSQKNKLIPIILILLFATPFFLAQWFFYHHGTDVTQKLGTVNHGQFIQPPVEFNSIVDTNTSQLKLKHQWYLVYITMTSDTNDHTEQALDKLYRIRVALGKEFSRVGELLGTLKEMPLSSSHNPLNIPSITVTQSGTNPLLSLLKSSQGIFLMDPSQHIFMAYPDTAPSDDIYQDIRRLLSNQ